MTRRRSRGGRWIARLGLLLAASIAWWLYAPYAAFSSPHLLVIAPGTSSWEMAQRLADEGIVRRAAVFEIWRLLHPGAVLKAGTYRFTAPASTVDVFDRLARGDVYFLALTVPEGFSRFDIERALQTLHSPAAADFLRVSADPMSVRDLDPQAPSLEGFLFPATYRLPPLATAQDVVGFMVRRFREELRAPAQAAVLRQLRASPAGRMPTSLHDWLTMASLIEKESALPGERPRIAAVFYNRLERHMLLQCDPTVIYAAERDQRYSGHIGHDDLTYDSPYNTYLHLGLPPGPIANPGLNALQAAAHPEASDYLYFVSNGAGAHRFARTLADHEQNVAGFLQSRKKVPDS